MSINKLQKTLIHIGISDLGISDETYRLMLRERFGVATCKDLQYSQASAFIDDLKRKGFRIKRKYRKLLRKRFQTAPYNNVVYLPTRQQLSLIEHLREDVIWRVHDGYWRWVKKFLGRTYIKNEREAQNVIEALKAMIQRQTRRHGDTETRGDATL